MRVKQQLVVTTGGMDYLSTAGLAQRYDVSTRTIERWEKNPKIGLPPPDLVINGRKYRKTKNVEVWERERATASTP
jgi:hypothetical protein